MKYLQRLKLMSLSVCVLVGGLLLASLSVAARAQEPIDLGSWAPISGVLMEDTRTAHYGFSAQAGDRISLTLASRDFDAYLILEANGQEVASNDDSEGSLNASIRDFTLPEDGEYVVNVTSADGQGTGTYTLTVIYLPVQDIQFDEDITVSFTNGMISSLYRFAGEAGTTISVSMSSVEIDSRLTLTNSAYELTYDDDGGGGLNALIGGFTLPETDTYFITASTFSQVQTGSYTLKLKRTELLPVAANSKTQAQMKDDALFFVYQGHVGEKVSARVISDGSIDTLLSIKNPHGQIVGWDDDSGNALDPEIRDIFLDQDGEYVLLVQALSGNASSDLTLDLEVEKPTVITCGTAQTLAFNQKLSQAVFVYDARAGQLLQVTISAAPNILQNINVNIVQDGNYLVSVSGDSQLPALTAEIEFTTAGRVQIQISDYYFRPNSIEMKMQCQ